MDEIVVAKMTRQEIYNRVWKISVASFAKELGIPYAQLMKQIKSADIPVPPSGYWTKLEYGKPVETIPLKGPADAVISLCQRTNSISVARAELPAPQQKKDSSQKVHAEAPKKTLPQSGPKAEAPSVELPAEQSLPPVETCQQYGQTYNIYKRETLYNEVWSMPVTDVAKRYQVSDVAIHKICKSLNIPTPAPGYWAKVRAGKATERTPLPQSHGAETKTGVRTGIKPEAPPIRDLLAFLPNEDREVVLAVAAQIMLPDEDAKMHPQVIAHRKKIADWHKESKKQNDYWLRTHRDSIPFLADTVPDDSLPRVFRIFDALIKAAEPLGCSLTAGLVFCVNGENVTVNVSESKDNVPHVPTREENIQLLKYEEEKKRHSWASKPNIRKYDHVYNGRLSVTVNGKNTLRDCKSYVIEDRLGDILIYLYREAENLRLQREAKEEAERRRKEEERQREERRERRNAEVRRTNALVNEANDYALACKIRSYIAAVEQKESLTEDDLAWIAWAKQKADWFDPTVKREDDFLGSREHGEAADKKELKESYSLWRW